MARLYFERDVDPSLIRSKRVAVLGFGNQGHAHALNLRDQGVDVVVGAREGGRGWASAQAHGFAPMSIAEASAEGEVLMLALPDESMADIYSAEVAPAVRPGKTVMVCHGFAFHFGLISTPLGVDVSLVGPKGSGASLRREFVAGRSLACFVAVQQDASGKALDVALSYAWGLGCARSVIIETTFQEECETDLFGEQVVLCGGIPELVKAAFETLVEAGYSRESAYLECLHEAKLITDLLYERGLAGMREAISDTAEWGGYQTGKRLIDDSTRQRMREVLGEIQSGEFARGWVAEAKSGKGGMIKLRQEEVGHPIEDVGKRLREHVVKKD